jgi:hypothetical protein
MSDDLESQRRALKPDSGMLVASGGGINLTPEQRALAEDKTSWPFATKLDQLGQDWFTRHGLNLTPSQMSIVQRGCELGIFRKDDHKEYWKRTPLTRAWLLTALALRDEWDKSPEAQRIRDAITPKTPEREMPG